MKTSEVMDGIREELNKKNIYKTAEDKVLRKIIKDNYMLVNLYRRVDYLTGSNDHSWDNVQFSGGC